MMPACAVLALLLSAAGQSAPQTAPVQAGSQASGLQALERQDYRQAADVFSRLSSADPQDYSALFYLALSETGLKEDQKAAENYKRVLTLKPGLYEAELNLGILYVRDHNPTDAIPLLRQAAQKKPDQARPVRYLGDALLASGDPSAAAEAYRAALSVDPKLAAAELGLGQSLAQQGKLDDALPHYRQAALLDPNLQSYLLEMAAAFSKANRGQDAVPLLKDFPNDPGACEELGRIYLTENRPSDAVTAFKAAVDISPTPANRLSLATAYLQNNQPDAAAPILEQALATDPGDYDLRMAVGRIYRDKRQYVTAANQFIAATQVRPDSVKAWNEAATAFLMAEEYPQALAALDKVRSLKAENAGDLYFRAMIYDKLHQVKPAIESYQRFLAMSDGKFPDQEFIARQRSRILEKEANR